MYEEPEWPQGLLCRWCVHEIHNAAQVYRHDLKPDDGAYRIADVAQFLGTAARGYSNPYASTDHRPMLDPRAVTMINGNAVCGEKWHITQAVNAANE